MPAPRKKANSTGIVGTVPRHEDCWAKTTKDNQPGITVRDHCLNVGCVAEALIEILPDWLKSALATQRTPVLAALHDIGKVSPGFQSKCANWLIEHIPMDRALQAKWATSEKDHAKISQYTVQQILQKSKLWDWAVILGAHHGKLHGLRIPGLNEADHEAWQSERQRLAEELIAV